jgi:hypothetical protein
MKVPFARSVWGLAAAVATTAFTTRADAQITEVARTPVADVAELTFGYRCDDRFVIRNDGARSVELEYALEKGNEHTKLTLGAREVVELDSKSKDAMELWMGGKLIAKAMKEKRSCKDVAGSASVLVAPLEVQESNPRDDRRYYGAGPFGDPWMYGYYGYSAFGFRPFYSGYVGIPIVIGGGGRGRGGPRGR